MGLERRKEFLQSKALGRHGPVASGEVWSFWRGLELLGRLEAKESLVEIAMDPSRTDCWVQYASFEAISCSANICGNLFFDIWSHAGQYGRSWDAVHLCEIHSHGMRHHVPEHLLEPPPSTLRVLRHVAVLRTLLWLHSQAVPGKITKIRNNGEDLP